MGNVQTLISIIASGIAVCSAPAVAVERTCSTVEIVSTGTGAIREPRAKEKAVEAWRGQAVTNHGIFYGSATDANDGKGVAIERCARTLVGLWVCQARGRPCIVNSTEEAANGTANEIPCNRDDLQGCNSTVKWVQNKLNAKGAGLAVDGVAGDATRQAIRDYKRTRKLGSDSFIDEKLVESLKG